MHHDVAALEELRRVCFVGRKISALEQLRDVCGEKRKIAALGELRDGCVDEKKIAALTELRSSCVAERKIGARLVEEEISSQARRDQNLSLLQTQRKRTGEKHDAEKDPHPA